LRLSVTALVCAYNEADVIVPVVGDLVGQGVDVYFIDHGSSDDTLARIEPFLGRGVVGIERLPVRTEAGGSGVPWADVLRRKQELACELESDWFIHHDADEFRESPWPGLNLVEAIAWVDRAGYNAIDFELLQFRPTHDRFREGEDPRESFPYYEEAEAWDRPQIRAWRRTAEVPDLESSGGHDVRFADRRVFPIRFLLRHYPIRGRAHAERKILQERRGRFAASERELGWHRQYDSLDSSRVIREPSELRRYDAEEVRLHTLLNHRVVEELHGAPEVRERLETERQWQRDIELRELDKQNREVERLAKALDERNREADRLGKALDERNREVDRFQTELAAVHDTMSSLRSDLECAEERADKLSAAHDALRQEYELATAQQAALLEEREGRLREVFESRSWRWSAPIRALAGLATRGGE